MSCILCRKKVFTSYLRFFPNGKVVCANSSGDKESMKKWLDGEFQNSGHYLVRGDNIKFNIVEEDLEIGSSFKGTILYDALVLKWKQKQTRNGLFVYKKGTFNIFIIRLTTQ